MKPRVFSTTLPENGTVNEQMQTASHIDWEQRRYEIAKDVFAHFPSIKPSDAVSLSDALISELKKEACT